MLSSLKVKTAKPETRAYKLADSGGLYLLVQPNGSKLWRYKFRINGTEGLQDNSIGGNIDVIEHCLAHAPTNAVRAAYNRHVYPNERRAMLQQWADYLDRLREEQASSRHESFTPVD